MKYVVTYQNQDLWIHIASRGTQPSGLNMYIYIYMNIYILRIFISSSVTDIYGNTESDMLTDIKPLYKRKDKDIAFIYV